MKHEKRRYFRINETIGLSYELLDSGGSDERGDKRVDIWSLMSEQDEKIEKLLLDVGAESPKIAELIRAFNQKLERVVGQIVMDSRLVDRLANKVKEVNISACGMGFYSDGEITLGSRLKLEIQLFPGERIIHTNGRVIGCDPAESGFFWRIDFFDMTNAAQEQLIQHIVQRQSAQLKELRS